MSGANIGRLMDSGGVGGAVVVLVVQWLARLPTELEDPGSNPNIINYFFAMFFFPFCSALHGHWTFFSYLPSCTTCLELHKLFFLLFYY